MGVYCKICEKNSWLFTTHSFSNSTKSAARIFFFLFFFLSFSFLLLLVAKLMMVQLYSGQFHKWTFYSGSMYVCTTFFNGYCQTIYRRRVQNSMSKNRVIFLFKGDKKYFKIRYKKYLSILLKIVNFYVYLFNFMLNQ